MKAESLSPDVGTRLLRLKLICFDFDGVFTDNSVYVDEDGREMVRCNRSDGIGLKKVKEIGKQLCVVSTESNQVVSRRCEKLKIECHQDVGDKLKVVKELAARLEIRFSEVCFVGNDINDLECMKGVGVSVAVADAWPEVLAAADLVLTRGGGMGVVREFCDLLVEVETNG